MFLSARYRPNIWPFWVLNIIEFGLTVALLALVGIAAPDLYRTKLWADGAENGFNSSPKAGMYAAANYRPYTTPPVWSQFITNYNLVIVVLSMFLMLVKSIMYMLHVFPPIVSALIHLVLVAIYTVSVYYQASSDMSDPRALQTGPPWYITKSCSVAKHPSNIGYCLQAKATFACFVAMLFIFLTYFGFAAFSCFPSKEHRLEYAENKRQKQEKYASLYSPDDEERDHELQQKTAQSVAYAVPADPMTPRTFAFNKLSGTKNMPLRLQIGKKKVESSQTAAAASTYPIRSPGFPATGFSQSPPQPEIQSQAETTTAGNGKAPMYFPPPPRTSTR